jgi:hypothetical protein
MTALPAPTASRRLISTPVFIILVTALAAALRFICLDRPALWYDEAATFSRICGTYDQMLDVLRADAFGPLHYEVEWVLSRWFKMTPAMLRMFPAVAGTLMIPAIYLLAFELLGHRVARASALLAACSAFLLAYSRDAKMYMPVWFFITLNVACLLRWMRTGSAAALLTAVAAGCAAVGLHATGSVVIALDVLVGLSGPNLTWRRGLLLLVTIVVIVAGPVGYITKFNRVSQMVDERGWGETKIDWVIGRTRDHDGAALTADSAASFLFAFSWLDQEGARVQVPRWIMASAAGILGLVTAAAVVGLVRWPNTAPAHAPAIQRWRATLWLSLWIFVPLYGFYQSSVPYAATTTDWRNELVEGLQDHHRYLWIVAIAVVGALAISLRQTRWMWMILAALLLSWCVAVPIGQSVLGDSYSTVPPPRWLQSAPWLSWIGVAAALPIVWIGCATMTRRRVQFAIGAVMIVGAVIGCCAAIDAAMIGVERHSIWMPRYLGFICPAVLIAAAALLSRLPFAWLRWSVFGLLLAINLAQAAAHIVVSSEPPLDQVAADAIAGFAPDGAALAYTPPTSPTWGPNGTGSIVNFCGEYYLFLLTNKAVTPQEFRVDRASDFFPLRLIADADQIAADVAQQPQARRVMVWDRLEPNEPPPPEDVLGRLGPTWREESPQLYPVRAFWDWGELYTYRRRVYIRT